MEWNLDCRYRLTGKYLCENGEQLLAFDLRSAEAFYYSGMRPGDMRRTFLLIGGSGLVCPPQSTAWNR